MKPGESADPLELIALADRWVDVSRVSLGCAAVSLGYYTLAVAVSLPNIEQPEVQQANAEMGLYIGLLSIFFAAATVACRLRARHLRSRAVDMFTPPGQE